MSTWKRPSDCADNACVEVAVMSSGVYVRQSEQERRIARFTPEEWRKFIEAAKRGEFDL